MIRYFTGHPTAANLLMLMLVVAGLMALPDLKKETFPDFSLDRVEISVPYPGATPVEVDEVICQPLLDAVETVSGVAENRCQAMENRALMVVDMMRENDFTVFLNEIKTQVEAITVFPAEVEKPIVQQKNRTDHVVSLAITGSFSTLKDQKAYCERIKTQLQRLPAVSLINLHGFSDHQIRIHLNRSALRQFQLTVQDVAQIISQQSKDLTAGQVLTDDQVITLRFMEQRHSPKQFESLVIVENKTGGKVLLKEMAIIEDRFELDEDKIIFNGQRACVLDITKTKSQDTLVVIDSVKVFVSAQREQAWPGVKFVLTKDTSTLVRDRLNMLVKNGIMGIILVFLTMWLFFDLRFSFWVAMGLPISFFGAFFLMSSLGYSINMITMVALIVAVGLLMDDAIVISENIASHIEQGKSAMTAAIDGVTQVLPGVLSSFLTTVCVFGPLAFLQGDIGAVLKVMPVVLIMVLIVSLIEAFLILPSHLAHSLKTRKPAFGFRLRIENQLNYIRENVVGRWVDLTIRWRYLTVGGVIGIFIITLGIPAGGLIKFQAFPDLDGDVIEARILMAAGTPLSKMEQVVDHLTRQVNKINLEYTPQQPGQQALIKNVSTQYNFNKDAHESGAHVATITVDLLSAEIRHGTIDDIIEKWRQYSGQMPDVININFAEFQLGPAGLPIEIRIQGEHYEQIDQATREMMIYLKQFAGVYDLISDLRPGKLEYHYKLKPGALGLGIDSQAIASQLRAAFYGRNAGELQINSEAYEIFVVLADDDKNSLSDLDDFFIKIKSGQLVPLSSVVTKTESRSYSRLHAINGLKTVTIQGNVDTNISNAQEIVSQTRQYWKQQLSQHHTDVSVSFEGQAKESSKTGASVRNGFLLGLIGIFIILSFQFRNYVEPFIVMLSIPLALIGVIWGHVLMGLTLSMPSMMGFASIAGIVVNDSILLIEFINLRLKANDSAREAAKSASCGRFRAILLTSLTTIAGMLPLLMETSLQAQVLIPLVTSLVFGLISATFLVLFVTPATFMILHDFGLTQHSESLLKTDDELTIKKR